MVLTTRPPLALVNMSEIILAAHSLDWRRAEEMLMDPEGAALLALLCNAKAKETPELYVYKNRLIRWAVDLAADWWAAPHANYGEYETDTVVYIQHGSTQYAFHVSSQDHRLRDILQDPPRSERGWSGIPLQPIAKQLAEEWFTRARVPFDVADQH